MFEIESGVVVVLEVVGGCSSKVLSGTNKKKPSSSRRGKRRREGEEAKLALTCVCDLIIINLVVFGLIMVELSKSKNNFC